MARSVTVEDYHWVMFTAAMTMFLCWALHEILERKLGMHPRITAAVDLQKKAAMSEHPVESMEMNNRFERIRDFC